MFLLFSEPLSNAIIKQTTNKYQLTNFDKNELIENQKKASSFEFDAVAPLSSEAIIQAGFSNKELSVIGGVAVPSVAINLPIFKGLSNEALMWGAGTMSESQEMGKGNYGLASHHAFEKDLLFSPLENVKKGEKVYVTNLIDIFEYQIVSIEIVDPSETHWLDDQPNQQLITLVTCEDVSGNNRRIVQGTLDSVVSIDHADSTMKAAFQLEQKTY